jgi:hypothetical protein
MRAASKSEVRAAAETLLSPLVEDLRSENQKIKEQLADARTQVSIATGRLERLSDQREKENAALASERERVQAHLGLERAKVEAIAQSVERRVQDARAQAKLSAEKGAKAAQTTDLALQEAREARKDAGRSQGHAAANRKDTENLLLQIRKAREDAEKGIRAEGVRQHDAIIQCVKNQESRLQSYVERVNEQANEILDQAQKTLRRATDLVEQYHGR